jgi:hypothetical protein
LTQHSKLYAVSVNPAQTAPERPPIEVDYRDVKHCHPNNKSIQPRFLGKTILKPSKGNRRSTDLIQMKP